LKTPDNIFFRPISLTGQPAYCEHFGLACDEFSRVDCNTAPELKDGGFKPVYSMV
jgi:hypothetical protein